MVRKGGGNGEKITNDDSGIPPPLFNVCLYDLLLLMFNDLFPCLINN